MYLPAVQNGIPSDEYWSKTFEEIIVQVDANQRIKEEDIKQEANLNYRLAQLMAYAMNEPSKMPSFESAYPFAGKVEEITEEERLVKEMEEDQQRMMIMAQAIKATRARKAKKQGVK